MEWEEFKVFGVKGPADNLSSQLNTEGVPSRVDAVRLGSGVETEYRVLVSSELAHRARWVLANANFSEEELNYIATGKLPGEKT